MHDRSNSFLLYKERINKALDFIDQHLCEDIHLDDISKAACFSSFHFHRIFKHFIGETPDDYIKRLRIDKSVWLLYSNKRLSVTEVALKCGFSSVSLFSKNFKKHFGFSPHECKKSIKLEQIKSKIRKAKIGVKNRNFKRKYKGEVKVEVLKMEAFKIAFVKHLNGNTLKQISNSYKKLIAWATPRALITDNTKVVTIHFDDPDITPENKRRFYEGFTIEKDIETSSEVSIMEIPSGIYAKIKFSGNPESFMDFFSKFINKWLIHSGYVIDEFPLFTLFNINDIQDEKKPGIVYKFDTYIKIKSL